MKQLTERETDVLQYLCHGYNNKEIADFMYLSQHTVKVYVSAILRKLGVENRTLAAFIAGQKSLVQPSFTPKTCRQCCA